MFHYSGCHYKFLLHETSARSCRVKIRVARVYGDNARVALGTHNGFRDC